MRRWMLGSAVLTVALVTGGLFTLLKIVPFHQNGLPSDVEAHYGALLEAAEAKARQHQILEAMQTIVGVPSNSDHFEQAYQLQETLSRELLRSANEKYNRADLAGAIDLLRAIPAHTSLGEQAKQQIEQLTQETRQLEAVQVAQTQGNWGEALRQLEALRGRPLSRSLPIQELLQQLILRAYHPGVSAVSVAGQTALPPRLTAPNPVIPLPRAIEPPPLAAVAVDVHSALASTRLQSATTTADSPPQPARTAVNTVASPSPEATPPVRSQVDRAVQPVRSPYPIAVLPSNVPPPLTLAPETEPAEPEQDVVAIEPTAPDISTQALMVDDSSTIAFSLNVADLVTADFFPDASSAITMSEPDTVIQTSITPIEMNVDLSEESVIQSDPVSSQSDTSRFSSAGVLPMPVTPYVPTPLHSPSAERLTPSTTELETIAPISPELFGPETTTDSEITSANTREDSQQNRWQKSVLK